MMKKIHTKIIPIKGTDNVIIRTKGYKDIVKQKSGNIGLSINTIVNARERVLKKKGE